MRLVRGRRVPNRRRVHTGADGADALGPGDGGEVTDAGAGCFDESARAFCAQQDFCDPFETGCGMTFDSRWFFQEADQGTLDHVPGRQGQGFSAKLRASTDGHVRLFAKVPHARAVAHVDFDVRTKRPSFNASDTWLDIVQFLSSQRATGGVGLEWNPSGLHLFAASSPALVVRISGTNTEIVYDNVSVWSSDDGSTATDR